MSEPQLAAVPDAVSGPAGAAFRPAARCPISPAQPLTEVAGWEVSGRRSTAALRLSDQSPLAKVQVMAPWDGVVAGELGVGHGRALFGAEASLTTEPAGPTGRMEAVIGSSPGEWLVLAPPGDAAELMTFLQDSTAGAAGSELVTVLDITHGRALVALTGRRAADVLAKVCAVDLSEQVTPHGTALRTSVASVATDVIYQKCGSVREAAGAGDPEPSYLLHCERSSGQYLFDALFDAGGEFGIDIDGFLPGQR